MTRFLIEHKDDIADVWHPAQFPDTYKRGQRQDSSRPARLAIWEQFADADKVFKALRLTPNYRLIETTETDAELEARRY